jgi:hypothetical protein
MKNVLPVRSAYQPPANSTFLSERTSHQQPASSTLLSEQTSTSHQSTEQAHVFKKMQICVSVYATQYEGAGRGRRRNSLVHARAMLLFGLSFYHQNFGTQQ